MKKFLSACAASLLLIAIACNEHRGKTEIKIQEISQQPIHLFTPPVLKEDSEAEPRVFNTKDYNHIIENNFLSS